MTTARIRFVIALAVASAGVIAVASPSAGVSGTTATRGLVGRWVQVLTCAKQVSALEKAGLGALASTAWAGQTSASGESSYAPGSPTPTNAHPCAGAIPRLHSHFFTSTGAFGSLDWHGEPVDDGSYRIINAHTLKIGRVAFKYSISGGGNRLTLVPVITAAMRRKALANPATFSEAGWAASVAMTGHHWKRASCAGWC
jgi:hypothetical protein